MLGFSIPLSGVRAGLTRLDAAAQAIAGFSAHGPAAEVDLAGELVGLIVAKSVVKANLETLRVRDETLGEILDLMA